ncbi:MAG: glycosyl hydrolase, partial [Enterococcus lemanii]
MKIFLKLIGLGITLLAIGGSLRNQLVYADSYNMVDLQAIEEARQLFGFLQSTQNSSGIMFGHQHSLDEGISLSGEYPRVGSTESEVKNAVGDYPAVFGWDTGSLDGGEKPGVPGDVEQSIKNTATSMKTAHDLGGIIVLSMHPKNFVTGGNYNDTSGNVVQNILPGGDYNSIFNQWLDQIATLADLLKDDEGNSIPFIFRPFHEQSGSWFWWGESTTTPEQYKAIYRYTVEYLKNTKNVHNILYAYSPGSTIPGDKEAYLKTYPGDNYVDLFGIDNYDSKQNAGSQTWLNGLVDDLEMIVNVAEEKGKIAALTEFGYSAQGMNQTGNTLDWYTRVLNAIQENEQARKIAYMLTWANFGWPNNMYVPYKDVIGDLGGDHEMLPNFVSYYNESTSLFLEDIKGDIYTPENSGEIRQQASHFFMLNPTNKLMITDSVVPIYTMVTNDETAEVTYEIEGITTEIPLNKEGHLFGGSFDLGDNFRNGSLTLVFHYYSNGVEVDKATIQIYMQAEINESELLIDDFERYLGENELLNQKYASNGDPISMSLSSKMKNSGDYGLQYDYTIATKGYSGRQLSVEKDWSDATKLSFWMANETASENTLTIQIQIGSVSFEADVDLSNPYTGIVEILFDEFVPASWEQNQTAKINSETLKNVSQFALYMGGNKGEGTLYFDDIQAIGESSEVNPILCTMSVIHQDLEGNILFTEAIQAEKGTRVTVASKEFEGYLIQGEFTKDV